MCCHFYWATLNSSIFPATLDFTMCDDFLNKSLTSIFYNTILFHVYISRVCAHLLRRQNYEEVHQHRMKCGLLIIVVR